MFLFRSLGPVRLQVIARRSDRLLARLREDRVAKRIDGERAAEQGAEGIDEEHLLERQVAEARHENLFVRARRAADTLENLPMRVGVLAAKLHRPIPAVHEAPPAA